MLTPLIAQCRYLGLEKTSRPYYTCLWHSSPTHSFPSSSPPGHPKQSVLSSAYIMGPGLSTPTWAHDLSLAFALAHHVYIEMPCPFGSLRNKNSHFTNNTCSRGSISMKLCKCGDVRHGLCGVPRLQPLVMATSCSLSVKFKTLTWFLTLSLLFVQLSDWSPTLVVLHPKYSLCLFSPTTAAPSLIPNHIIFAHCHCCSLSSPDSRLSFEPIMIVAIFLIYLHHQMSGLVFQCLNIYSSAYTNPTLL
jgi:hypothetical protein